MEVFWLETSAGHDQVLLVTRQGLLDAGFGASADAGASTGEGQA
jgi:hypothetical protein